MATEPNYTGTSDGDHYVYTGAASYSFSGGSGNDFLMAAQGGTRQNGSFDGGVGDDSLSAFKTLHVVAHGGDGADEIYVFDSEQADLHGGNGNDYLTVSPKAGFGAFLYGDHGNDSIFGGGVGTLVSGGEGDDVVYASGGERVEFGRGDGWDHLHFNYLGAADSIASSEYKAIRELHFRSGILPGDVRLEGNEKGGVDIVVAPFDRISIETDGVDSGSFLNNPIYTIQKITFASRPDVVWSKSDLLATLARPVGNDESQRLVGGAENDFIDAKAGNDVVIGLGGADTLIGGLGGDSLDGGQGDDSLQGSAGRDTLQGGTGTDILFGGEGDDVYYIDQASDIVVEDASSGSSDELYASATYKLPDHIEYAELTGTGNFNLTGNNTAATLNGNAGNNLIIGGLGADELNGGDAGLDTLQGGLGDDRYVINRSTDVVTERPNEGFDAAFVFADNYQLAANVEKMNLMGDALTGTGNNGANSIYGNLKSNSLFGLGGADKLYGGAGNDVLYGGTGFDQLQGGSGNDTYVFAVGDGMDVITNSDVTGFDVLSLKGVNESQVWFTAEGSDLGVGIVGRDEVIYIKGWNEGQTNRIDAIKLDNGKVLAASKVDGLVQAMSAFTPPAAGQTTLPSNYQSALGGTIAASWAAA